MHIGSDRLSRRGIALAAFLLQAFAPAMTDAQSARGVITGRVYDATTEEPLPGVTIRVLDQQAAAQSDDAGRFTLTGVAPGIVRLEARRLGYAPFIRADLPVSAGKPTEVSIALVRVGIQLQGVVVRPSAFPAQLPVITPVSSTVLTSEELRRTPGALEDVVQALSIAPGIATTSGGRNDLFVRGGASFENLFLVDNVEVPNINHFGTQGATGGPISLLNIRFIDNVKLSVGGFGVRYGDRVSSATDITLREGNHERIAGEGNIAATQFGAVVEGPIGANASFLANVRRSYLDFLFQALGQSFVPSYTDATFKATWRPGGGKRDAFSFLVIGARDKVDFTNDDADDRFDNSRILAPAQDQYFSGLTWKRLFARGVATTTLGRTWTRYRTAQSDSLGSRIFLANTTEGENSLRTDVTWLATPSLTIDAGNIAKLASNLAYDVDIPGFARFDSFGVPIPLRIDTTFRAFRNGTYAQATWPATPRLRLGLGLRGDHYGFLADAYTFAPRVSATIRLDEPTTLTLSAGRFTQAPSFIWLVGDAQNPRTLQPLRADQAVVSLQRLVGDEWRWQVEGYVKRYADYPARRFRPNAVLQPSGFDDVRTDIPFGLEPLEGAGTGHVYGMEATLQKKLGRIPVYGVASLTLNRTSFTALAGPATRGAFDTPLIANVVAGWRPNAKWELSGRMRASTGLPFTPLLASGAAAGRPDFTRYNGERLPTFFSVDARVDRRWTIRRTQLVTFLDVANVNGRMNVSGYQWNDRFGTVEAQEGLRVLPSIGINWEF